MGAAPTSEVVSGYLLQEAADPFLDGAQVKVVKKQRAYFQTSGDSVAIQTPLTVAVLELATASQNIANGRGLATKKSQLLQITDNVLFFLLKQCLSFVGCDLVKKKGHFPHVFIIESRPHNLALALCTISFQQNLINMYDGLSVRQAFQLKPPLITYMMLRMLTLYEDYTVRLANIDSLQWEMPVEL